MTESNPAPDPSGETSRCILVVVEDTPLGRHTTRIGMALAADMGARAIFHVALPVEATGAESAGALENALDEHRRLSRERLEPVFEALRQAAAERGVACETVLTVDKAPGDAVLKLAADEACLVIVAGSRGRGGVVRLLSGSLMDELLQRAPCPVLFCREEMGYGVVTPIPETQKASTEKPSTEATPPPD